MSREELARFLTDEGRAKIDRLFAEGDMEERAMTVSRVAGVSFDKLAARQLDTAANIASGLNLEEIGEDGCGVANRLWRIAAYLRRRDDNQPPDVTRLRQRYDALIRELARLTDDIEDTRDALAARKQEP